jgi:hypothetical protein
MRTQTKTAVRATPTPTVAQQLAALQGMGPAALRARFLEVFGEVARTGNKDYLYKRVAWRIQSLAEGGLSERARRRADELARDADLRTTAPRVAAVTAGAGQRTITRVAPRISSDARLPIPGTVLTKTYKGKHVAVTVLDDGFEHEGQTYKSLSAVAKAVTGSHWNGLLFFGLAQPKRSPQ